MKKQSIKSDASILNKLSHVIQERKASRSPDSYTASLFISGTQKIHDKIAEESGELIEASQQANREGIIHETADLIFHMIVLLGQWNIAPHEIYSELNRRWGLSGLAEKQHRTKGAAHD